MDLKELTIGGRKVILQTVRERWEAGHIFDFIAGELRIEQESWVLGGKQSTQARFAEAAQREKQKSTVEQRSVVSPPSKPSPSSPKIVS